MVIGRLRVCNYRRQGTKALAVNGIIVKTKRLFSLSLFPLISMLLRRIGNQVTEDPN